VSRLSPQERGVALCLAAGLVWSCQGLLLRSVVAADAWQINAWRSGLTALVALCIIVARYRGGAARAFAAVGRIGLVAALLYAISNTGFVVAITLTTVANTLFMLSAEPLIVALLAWLLLGERVSAATVAGIALAAIGVTVMIGGSIGGGVVGTLVAFTGSFAFAAFTVTLRVRPTIDMLPVIVVSGVMVMTAAVIVTGGRLAIAPGDAVLCAAMAAASTVGTIAFMAGARALPAARVILLAMVEVVLGPLWVFLAYGERPAATTLVGGAIVLGAVALQTFGGRRAAA